MYFSQQVQQNYSQQVIIIIRVRNPILLLKNGPHQLSLLKYDCSF